MSARGGDEFVEAVTELVVPEWIAAPNAGATLPAAFIRYSWPSELL